MDFNLVDSLDIHGHLEISKVFPDGNEEVVFADHNIIVSGMSLGLAHLFSLSTSSSPSILDYQIDRFQIGVSGYDEIESDLGREIYQLSGSLTSVGEYGGVGSEIALMTASQYKNDTIETGQVFGLIPDHKVTRIEDKSVRYTIVLDTGACNDIQRNATSVPINEIGLFMKNPFNASPEQSILVAYRKFSDITKTSEFALVFRWTINL